MPKRKNPPSKVKIYDKTWAVELIKPPILINGAELNGYADRNKTKIVIANDLEPQLEQEVVLHEVMHGIFNHHFHAVDNMNEELCVDCMTKGILTVLRDNKDLKEYLLP